MGELTDTLDEIKENYKEAQDDEQIWDELYELRDILRVQGKVIRLLAEYIDAKEEGGEVDIEELKEKVTREQEKDPVR